MFEYLSSVFEDHVAVDPFRDGFAADLLDERREVLGRDAELPGIESDAALLLVVFAEQLHELSEILLGPAVHGVLDLGMLGQIMRQNIPTL